MVWVSYVKYKVTNRQQRLYFIGNFMPRTCTKSLPHYKSGCPHLAAPSPRFTVYSIYKRRRRANWKCIMLAVERVVQTRFNAQQQSSAIIRLTGYQLVMITLARHYSDPSCPVAFLQRWLTGPAPLPAPLLLVPVIKQTRTRTREQSTEHRLQSCL